MRQLIRLAKCDSIRRRRRPAACVIRADHVLSALAVGLGATLFMDLLALLLKHAFGVASPSYCLVGRWFCHMLGGTFVHGSIADAPQRPRECAVGWVAHYVIGAGYAVMLVTVASGSWLAQPTLVPALLFGVCTVLVPFLIMQPSFGLGVAGSKAPNPAQVRFRSVMAHTTFGIGLYACAVGLGHVLRVHV